MERGYVNLKREKVIVREEAQTMEEMVNKLQDIVKDAKLIRGGDSRKIEEV